MQFTASELFSKESVDRFLDAAKPQSVFVVSPEVGRRYEQIKAEGRCGDMEALFMAMNGE